MAQQLHQASFFLFNNDSESHTPSIALVSGDVFLITADSHTRLLVLLLLMKCNILLTQHRFSGCIPSVYNCNVLNSEKGVFVTGCVGQRSEDKSLALVTRPFLFLRVHSGLLQPPKRESSFDLTSVRLAHAPDCMKYSILRPPCLPNPEPFRSL